MNRFQPLLHPGKKFPACRKLLRQSNMGLDSALAIRAAASAFCRGAGVRAASFARRDGTFPLVFLINL